MARAPWRISAKNSSSGPRRQLPRFFFISVQLLPALAKSATKSRTLFIPELCGGGTVLLFPVGFSGAQRNFRLKPVL